MEKSTTQIEQHVKILGWLLIGANVFGILVGGFVFFLLLSVGALSGDSEALGVMMIVGMFVAGILLIFSLPGIAAGWGLLKRKSWARLLGLVFSFISLWNFPLGTAVGVYGFYVLMQESAAAYFLESKYA